MLLARLARPVAAASAGALAVVLASAAPTGGEAAFVDLVVADSPPAADAPLRGSTTPPLGLMSADAERDDAALTRAALEAAARVAPPPEVEPPRASGLAGSGLPEVALHAYRRAEATLADSDPGCRLDWSLLAGIGRVESDHGRYGGAVPLAGGRSEPLIIGIPLDGRPGVAEIRDTDNGRLDGDTVYDRAVGPMQFIPGTWAGSGVDGNGDGVADPHNIYDAALTAGVYLCAGDGDLSVREDREAAVFRYNRSREYVDLVLALADAYARGSGGDPLPAVDAGPSVDVPVTAPSEPASPRRPVPPVPVPPVPVAHVPVPPVPSVPSAHSAPPVPVVPVARSADKADPPPPRPADGSRSRSGDGDAAPPVDDGPPRRDGETPPPGDEETPPPADEPPRGGDETPPPGDEETPPPGDEETPPPGDGDEPPPGDGKLPPCEEGQDPTDPESGDPVCRPECEDGQEPTDLVTGEPGCVPPSDDD